MTARWIPDDLAIEVRRFELVVFLSEDGTECLDWRWTGEPVTLMQAIGHIETAKLGIYSAQWHEHREDDDGL